MNVQQHPVPNSASVPKREKKQVFGSRREHSANPYIGGDMNVREQYNTNRPNPQKLNKDAAHRLENDASMKSM